MRRDMSVGACVAPPPLVRRPRTFLRILGAALIVWALSYPVLKSLSEVSELHHAPARTVLRATRSGHCIDAPGKGSSEFSNPFSDAGTRTWPCVHAAMQQRSGLFGVVFAAAISVPLNPPVSSSRPHDNTSVGEQVAGPLSAARRVRHSQQCAVVHRTHNSSIARGDSTTEQLLRQSGTATRRPRCAVIDDYTGGPYSLMVQQIGVDRDTSFFCGPDAPSNIACRCLYMDRCYSYMDRWGRDIGYCGCCSSYRAALIVLWCLVAAICVFGLLYFFVAHGAWWFDGYPSGEGYTVTACGDGVSWPTGTRLPRGVFRGYRGRYFREVPRDPNRISSQVEDAARTDGPGVTAHSASPAASPDMRSPPDRGGLEEAFVPSAAQANYGRRARHSPVSHSPDGRHRSPGHRARRLTQDNGNSSESASDTQSGGVAPARTTARVGANRHITGSNDRSTVFGTALETGGDGAASNPLIASPGAELVPSTTSMRLSSPNSPWQLPQHGTRLSSPLRMRYVSADEAPAEAAAGSHADAATVVAQRRTSGRP